MTGFEPFIMDLDTDIRLDKTMIRRQGISNRLHDIFISDLTSPVIDL